MNAIAECHWCGTHFETWKAWLRRGRGRFCSDTCKGKYGRSLQDQTGKNNNAWKHGQARSPARRRAWNAVAKAKAKGRLKAGSCAVCGATASVHAHHPNYDKPLEIVWLCRAHHDAEHALAI